MNKNGNKRSENRSVTQGRLYTIGGLDWWTGLVDWTTGLIDFHSKMHGDAP